MRYLDEALLRTMTQRLVDEFNPDQIILFGSHAWGTPTEESDIDLFVIIPDSEERPLQRTRRALACLKDVKAAKDILVRTRKEAEKYRDVHASLECQVFERGRVLYGKH